MINVKRVNQHDYIVSNSSKVSKYGWEGNNTTKCHTHVCGYNSNHKVALQIKYNVLNNIIKKVTERVSKENAIKFTYLILYALLEPLCYAKGLPPSLADTRVPTHTVIDHVYATTTAVNMVFGSSENKPLSGFLVCIDFPGIHEFIDSARKAGDFWAGSWIISEITWRLTEKMIDIFGPDVVISPTTRMNPYFYFRYFINLLKKYCGDDKVINEIREIIIKFLENITGDKIPLDEIEWQPLIPGTVFLILPKNENIAEWTKDEKSIVLLKLNSGYNIGFNKKDVVFC